MNYLNTGNIRCYDQQGTDIPCNTSGQDAEFGPGLPWPTPRFERLGDEICKDRLTHLIWPRNANLFTFPLTWEEALETIRDINEKNLFGHSDWRLPNRRELRSLINHGAKKPALPSNHPFKNIFLGWYWTSTTAAIAPAYAWYVHMEGGRMFYGKKDYSYMVWPVRGNGNILPRTGQADCYSTRGTAIECRKTGQDGEILSGVPWPSPRFERTGYGMKDNLTGLVWHRDADPSKEVLTWENALSYMKELAEKTKIPWRLPTINELESLVDCSCHSPALPAEHEFTSVQDGYWSSTTSFFEPDWSYVLYLNKGAVGVGWKKKKEFFAWPVTELG